jgi:predicted metalloprotease
MKWTPGRRSSDLEDRRGETPAYGGGGFRMGGLGRAAPMGLGGIAILFVLSLLTGTDLTSVFTGSDPGQMAPDPASRVAPTGPASSTPEEERLVDFVSFVLDDAQATWQQLLPGYQNAQLVLFREATNTACGLGQSATGPFYCPGDHKVYIDLAFYEELKRRFGAPGDFAQAYVLAHEIGHHVQSLTGTERQVRNLQQSRPDQANPLSVRMELQADCYAGIWGHSAARRDKLDTDDVEEGLAAAAAIGDDRLTGGRVAPDRFTHGTSAQRVEWFRRGLQSGRMESCDTFNAR